MRYRYSEIAGSRQRALTLLAIVLLALSFVAFMMWEVAENSSDTRFRFRSTKVGVLVGDHLTVYLVPEDHWPCRTDECKYGPFRNDSIGAVSMPMWIIATTAAVWPIWWLRRIGRLRLLKQSEYLAQRREGVPRLVLSVILLSHMLASYAACVPWACVERRWHFRGEPLVEAPLLMITELPNMTRYAFTSTRGQLADKLLLVASWITYLIAFTTVVRLLLIAPLKQGKRSRRAARGLCPTCGYDLRATPDRCPECGHEVSRETESPEHMPGAAMVG